ncbi:MAG TPA: tripartite tricarboxylate transporter TctB family protein, partial [Candidatus Competibacteraceae bacterium]|nr:tripartite tricarboxylate transporter TctB family protein [Candidatus Competibacteraceae bacterium]
LFSQVIHVAGLVLTTAALVVVSRLARPGYAWRETLALTAMLTVLCVAVFHYGLGLQFPLWPNLG